MALARGESLPGRTSSSALFADISGFTPRTEKLTRSLGPRRGIEALTRKINAQTLAQARTQITYESMVLCS